MVFKKAFPLVVVSPKCDAIDRLLNSANNKLFTRIVWIQKDETERQIPDESNANIIIYKVSYRMTCTIDQEKRVVELWNETDLVIGFSFALCIEVLKIKKENLWIQVTTASRKSTVIQAKLNNLIGILLSVELPSAESILKEIERIEVVESLPKASKRWLGKSCAIFFIGTTLLAFHLWRKSSIHRRLEST